PSTRRRADERPKPTRRNTVEHNASVSAANEGARAEKRATTDSSNCAEAAYPSGGARGDAVTGKSSVGCASTATGNTTGARSRDATSGEERGTPLVWRASSKDGHSAS